LKKISDIIDDFIKDYNPSDEYLELLIKIKDYYGKYEYGSGFFTPVLHVLFPILQYIKSVSFKELYIIGHSLGGAESSIFLMLFLYIQKLPGYDFKDIKLVTFGEPSGLKNNKNGQELVKKIQKEKFKYTRVVSFFKDGEKIQKDIIVTGNPLNNLYFDRLTKLEDLPEEEHYKVVSPDGELWKE
jgi:hypothetical protein